MADIYAVFGSLLALGIAFPGLMLACWLFFPGRVRVAKGRLSKPWRCFRRGLVRFVVLVFAVFTLLALSFPASQLLAALFLIASLAFAGLGAAGITASMAERLAEHHQRLASPLDFVKAAVAYELAAVFPIIGWFVVIPLSIIMALGAVSYRLAPVSAALNESVANPTGMSV